MPHRSALKGGRKADSRRVGTSGKKKFTFLNDLAIPDPPRDANMRSTAVSSGAGSALGPSAPLQASRSRSIGGGEVPKTSLGDCLAQKRQHGGTQNHTLSLWAQAKESKKRPVRVVPKRGTLVMLLRAVLPPLLRGLCQPMETCHSLVLDLPEA